MSIKWLFLFAVVSMVDSNPPRTSANTNHAHRNNRITSNNNNDVSHIANTTAPSSIVERIANFPLSIVGGILEWVNGMLSSLISDLVIRIWKITRNYVIPRLDTILVEIAKGNTVPENLRDLINQAHSAYTFVQIFGYMKPA